VGVVHRDLKPDNVFLEPCPEKPPAVRLLDFGISRAVQAAGGSARRTRTGMLLGTPGYMSPEQVKSSKDADQRSDLYSAGILFYELITGQRAFHGSTEYERMTAVLFSDVRPIAQVAPQYAHWGAFFDKALAREPEQRFADAGAMREALAAVATRGRMPETAFGGDATAISPTNAGAPPVPAAPDVRIVKLPPRTLRLSLAVLASLAAVLLGFLLGFWVGRS